MCLNAHTAINVAMKNEKEAKTKRRYRAHDSPLTTYNFVYTRAQWHKYKRFFHKQVYKLCLETLNFKVVNDSATPGQNHQVCVVNKRVEEIVRQTKPQTSWIVIGWDYPALTRIIRYSRIFWGSIWLQTKSQLWWIINCPSLLASPH